MMASSLPAPRIRERPPPASPIYVLFFPPGAPPELRTIENTAEAIGELLGGFIDTFVSGVSGTVLVANDDQNNPFSPTTICPVRNRQIPVTKSFIYGPFFIGGDDTRPRDIEARFRSLRPHELKAALETLAPELQELDRYVYFRQLEEAEALNQPTT